MTAAAISSTSHNQSDSSIRSSPGSDAPEENSTAQHSSSTASSWVTTAFADPTGFVSDFCALSVFPALAVSSASFSFLGDLQSRAQCPALLQLWQSPLRRFFLPPDPVAVRASSLVAEDLAPGSLVLRLRRKYLVSAVMTTRPESRISHGLLVVQSWLPCLSADVALVLIVLLYHMHVR
jgi:hypothetical protein